MVHNAGSFPSGGSCPVIPRASTKAGIMLHAMAMVSFCASDDILANRTFCLTSSRRNVSKTRAVALQEYVLLAHASAIRRISSRVGACSWRSSGGTLLFLLNTRCISRILTMSSFKRFRLVTSRTFSISSGEMSTCCGPLSDFFSHMCDFFRCSFVWGIVINPASQPRGHAHRMCFGVASCSLESFAWFDMSIEIEGVREASVQLVARLARLQRRSMDSHSCVRDRQPGNLKGHRVVRYRNWE